jgi:hypothetical protein
MCIAIAKYKGNFITKETLQNCWDSNPDGAGFAYKNEEGSVVVQKFMRFEDFYKAYAEIDNLYGDTQDMVIHFRITSRGATAIYNCHPFIIDDKMAFIHNGTITSMPISKEHDYSDTFMFNELILKKLPAGWEDSIGVKHLIEDMISYSKIVVLHVDKGLYIYNESKGVKFGGNWYSNTTYEPSRVIYRGKNWWRKADSDTKDIKYISQHEDWDWEKETYKEYKERMDAEDKEKARQEELFFQELAEDADEGTKEVENISASILIPCDKCNHWVDEEDMYTINTSNIPQKIEFYCEDCVIDLERKYIPYEPIYLDEARQRSLFLRKGVKVQ